MKTVKQIREIIKNETPRSTWDKAVKLYALELLEDMPDDTELTGHMVEDNPHLLNGANNWNHYSWGGCSLAYDYDIAERLCSPSELKKRHGGDWKPNRSEEWLDVQARALNQAARLIRSKAR